MFTGATSVARVTRPQDLVALILRHRLRFGALEPLLQRARTRPPPRALAETVVEHEHDGGAAELEEVEAFLAALTEIAPPRS